MTVVMPEGVAAGGPAGRGGRRRAAGRVSADRRSGPPEFRGTPAILRLSETTGHGREAHTGPRHSPVVVVEGAGGPRRVAGCTKVRDRLTAGRDTGLAASAWSTGVPPASRTDASERATRPILDTATISLQQPEVLHNG